MNEGAVTVSIDLLRVRQNAEAIRSQTGVPIIAVVKADAYGLGATEVASAIGDLVNAFYVFDSAEAVKARLWGVTGRRTIALHSDWTDADDFLPQHIQPVVWSAGRARQLRGAKPVLSVDTGQQRFSAPADDARDIYHDGDCTEVMTHATNLSQVQELLRVVSSWNGNSLFLHAAASALLDQPAAWLNAVRPGLALYQGAVTVTARLVEVRDSNRPAGYSGFISPRFGIVFAGYSSGLRRGPCRINGQTRRVLEVGMQSAFVETGPEDRKGDEVMLLGADCDVDLASLARAWSTSQQEVLVRLTKAGERKYRGISTPMHGSQ
jgi:alanine racemase